MKKPTETDLVRACLELLAICRVFAFRQNTGGMVASYKGKHRYVRFGVPGAPDIIGVLPGGRFLGIEVKMPGNKPTGDQQVFLDRVNAEGGVGICVSSIADLESFLRDMGVTK